MKPSGGFEFTRYSAVGFDRILVDSTDSAAAATPTGSWNR